MVAYSFKTQFCEAIVTGKKCQTIRANRKRHAHVGEPIQLYYGMRTKQCRKLVDPDPICTAVRPVIIKINPLARLLVQAVSVDGYALIGDEIDRFALKDGFYPVPSGSSRQAMGKFWLKEHAITTFEGVLIEWKPAHG